VHRTGYTISKPLRTVQQGEYEWCDEKCKKKLSGVHFMVWNLGITNSVKKQREYLITITEESQQFSLSLSLCRDSSVGIATR
jgi:hypothetical protein